MGNFQDSVKLFKEIREKEQIAIVEKMEKLQEGDQNDWIDFDFKAAQEGFMGDAMLNYIGSVEV